MRILVAYDGTDGANAALTAAANVAKASSADVVVLHVLNPLIDAADVVAPTTHDAMVTVAARARAALEARVAVLGLQADVRIEQLTHGEDAWEHIVHVAQDVDANMIAIGSRRAGGLTGAILGSVVRAVVQHSPCPVLVVRPDND